MGVVCGVSRRTVSMAKYIEVTSLRLSQSFDVWCRAPSAYDEKEVTSAALPPLDVIMVCSYLCYVLVGFIETSLRRSGIRTCSIHGMPLVNMIEYVHTLLGFNPVGMPKIA